MQAFYRVVPSKHTQKRHAFQSIYLFIFSVINFDRLPKRKIFIFREPFLVPKFQNTLLKERRPSSLLPNMSNIAEKLYAT